jgi:single-strand DNA-binding protein
MRSVNKVIIVGHLVADPETATTQSGRTRVTFSVATHRDTTSDGVKKEVTDYHRIVAWAKLGEICAKYLGRGQAVYVEGQILNRAYEHEGMRKYVTEVRADEVNMLTWKKKDGVSNVTIEDPAATA